MFFSRENFFFRSGRLFFLGVYYTVYYYIIRVLVYYIPGIIKVVPEKTTPFGVVPKKTSPPKKWGVFFGITYFRKVLQNRCTKENPPLQISLDFLFNRN